MNDESKWRKRFEDGGWLPKNREAVKRALKNMGLVPAMPGKAYLQPAVQELKHLIEDDPEVYMGFNDMLKQKATNPIINTTSLLDMLSDAINRPPAWTFDPEDPNSHPGLVINTIVSAIVTTEFGFATFLNPKVNAVFKKILDAWNRFLATPASNSTLTTDGWLSDNAMTEFAKYLLLPEGASAKDRFQAAFVRAGNASDDHWGFRSWDHFFTRRFINIDVTRPLPHPAPDPTKDDVIVSACESTIYNINENAQEDGKFWLKGKEYSLRMMLNEDENAPLFYGGIVYQAFLDVWDYHRWHSPVKGTVRKVVNVPGTYYALPPDFYNPDDPDEIAGIVLAQAFLAVAATRALIFIESDNPDIGLMCFIGVGMIDVSSCEITVRSGDRVEKGQQIGLFHFGGSTSCLVFQPGLDFTLREGLEWGDPDNASHVAIRSELGTLKPNRKV